MLKVWCKRHYCSSFDKKCFITEIRSIAEGGIHSYFNNDNFIHVDLPVLSSTAISILRKKLFHITMKSNENREIYPFDQMVYLRPSGQAHIGTMVSAISRVYSIGPCFGRKNDPSNSLNEYWLAECEEAFLSGNEGYSTLENRCINCLEYLVNYIHNNVPNNYSTNHLGVQLLHYTEKILEDLQNIRKISYTDVIDHLSTDKELGHVYKYGDYLEKDTITSITRMCNNRPFIIQKYPNNLSEFHIAKTDENKNECYKFGFYMPNYDKVVVGSIKENDMNNLMAKYKEDGGDEEYMKWFFESRKWGTPPSGGLIIGFDRLLQYIMQIKNIEDVSSFPRTHTICDG